jgi:hypothetical protein
MEWLHGFILLLVVLLPSGAAIKSPISLQTPDLEQLICFVAVQTAPSSQS